MPVEAPDRSGSAGGRPGRLKPHAIAPLLAAAALVLQTPVLAQDFGPDEVVVLPPGLYLTNAVGGAVKRSPAIEQAMMMGDADRVRSAGGSPMDVLATLRRQLQHNPQAMTKLRKFVDTSDGARITFGHYLGSYALMRRTRDGKATYISLDAPFADIIALE